MLIDCDRCVMRDIACSDCVVTALLRLPGPGCEIGEAEGRALRVLAASLIWTDTHHWWPFVPLFAAIVAPAERRMGWWRWLLVGIAAHVIGTYVSQAYLRREILEGRAPRKLIDASDVGVSYFGLGLAGALTGYVPHRRWIHQVVALAALGTHTAARPTFTEVGHLTAFLVGLAAIPVLPDREAKPFPPSSARSATPRRAPWRRSASPDAVR